MKRDVKYPKPAKYNDLNENRDSPQASHYYTVTNSSNSYVYPNSRNLKFYTFTSKPAPLSRAVICHCHRMNSLESRKTPRARMVHTIMLSQGLLWLSQHHSGCGSQHWCRWPEGFYASWAEVALWSFLLWRSPSILAPFSNLNNTEVSSKLFTAPTLKPHDQKTHLFCGFKWL